MILVIDSNVIISALIKNSKTREIILKSGFNFVHPFIALKNIEKYKGEIIEKSGINKEEYKVIYNLLIKHIALIKTEFFLKNLEKAKKIMGHIDIEDVPFVALALSIKNNGIWSDDRHFKIQKSIKTYNTKELIKFLQA